jgi:solute carrier family 12 (sodium/potassium/chloride transporter), member 2
MTDSPDSAADSGSSTGYGFGTFKGVFTPSILTILGVIMYLRLPWVLGSVGLAQTVLIVTVSTFITFVTALSISAMATNMKVGAGGAYFMISRTLGLEVGAAVGLPLFLAQALGIAFYTVGFTELAVAYFPQLPPTIVGVATIGVLTALAYLSADLALKSQFVILALLLLSLAAFFAGGPPGPPGAVVGEALPSGTFWVAFAVFFPAVTGIEAGLGMSGDLKNPSRALPLGTMLAVGVGYLVYLAIPVFLSMVVSDPAVLLSDSLITTRVARWPELVVLGILGASLSSAMGALLGAPRTLQSLAKDRVVPRILGRGYGAGRDPRLATIVAFLIALAGILFGDLNSIASILSMFFLTSYAVLNLSAGLEGLIGSPAWRPDFRVPWWVSMLGFAACVIAMLMIDAGATIVAVVLSALVYLGVQRRQLHARWGDVRYGVLMLIVRLSLEALSRMRPDARSWNPNVLVLSGAPSSRWHLVVIGRALAGESGLLTVATVLTDPGQDLDRRATALRRTVEQYLEQQHVPALVKIVTDSSVTSGLIALVRSYGFGPLVPNTVMVGKSVNSDNPVQHAELLALIQRRRSNLIVLHEGEDLPVLTRARRIDIWWRGHRRNFGLMLALAFLLKQHEAWDMAEVWVWRIVDTDDQVREANQELDALLGTARFATERHVIVQPNGDSFDIIRTKSRQADLVFLGLRPIADDESFAAYADYYAETTKKTEALPPTALVSAGDEVDLHRLFKAR